MKRSLRMDLLKKKIKICKLCKGMNIPGVTENAPGYGNIRSKVLLVGQSLCTLCMKTQIPFTGGSGAILDEVFKGLGVQKSDIFITNLVHCHPEGNRPSTPKEIGRCCHFLDEEVDIVRPRLIVTLGTDARDYFGKEIGLRFGGYEVVYVKSRGYVVYPAYHPAFWWRKGGIKAAEDYITEMVSAIRPFI